MSANKLYSLGQGQEGVSFANALNECYVCGVVLIDGGGKIAAVSAEAAQLLGRDPGKILYNSFEGLPEPLPQIVYQTLSGGKPVVERQVELPAPGRQPAAVRVKALPIEPGGKAPGVILVLTGVMVQSRLDKQIRQLDRLASIGSLTASVAHEIRNALVAGKTFTDLLLEENKGGELVDVVRRETGRIDALVNRMLKFAGTNRETFSPVHLHEILDHSLRLVQPQLESRGIVLDRSFQASPDMVNGDDYGLEQAFVNLLANAMEAIGEKGTLSVATERTAANTDPPDGVFREMAGAAAQLRVTIKDTGVGIPAANMGHMFQPFFTTKPTGTGLGLVITRQIVQEHRGSLTVQSQQGQGTTFQITLPEG